MPKYEIVMEQRLKLRKTVTINADKALDALKEVYERFGDEITLSMEDRVENGACVDFYAVSADKQPVLVSAEEEEVEEKLLNGMCFAEGLHLHERLKEEVTAKRRVLRDLEDLQKKAFDNDLHGPLYSNLFVTGIEVKLYDVIPANVFISLLNNKITLIAKPDTPYVIEEEIGYFGCRCKKVCSADISLLIAEQWDDVKAMLTGALDSMINHRNLKKDEYKAEARVYLASGGVRHLFHTGSKAECQDLCETYGWEYKDENEFIWSMELDELD